MVRLWSRESQRRRIRVHPAGQPALHSSICGTTRMCFSLPAFQIQWDVFHSARLWAETIFGALVGSVIFGSLYAIALHVAWRLFALLARAEVIKDGGMTEIQSQSNPRIRGHLVRRFCKDPPWCAVRSDTPTRRWGYGQPKPRGGVFRLRITHQVNAYR